MHYFDYEKVARQANISPEKLNELSQVIRQDLLLLRNAWK